MADDYQEFKSKMQKTVEVLKREYATIRAGRANPAVLDRITIDYYGTQTPLHQVASISAPEAKTLVIQPWDASVLKAVEKAILTSDIGINPQNDGKILRLHFPPLTEERRKELIRHTFKIAEEAKVAIRNIRREAIEIFKGQKKKSEITEDDFKIVEEDIQQMTDNYCKEIDAVAQKKEKELLEI